MFPLSVTQYVQLGICAIALLFSAYLGYSYEHSRFMAFKSEIEAIARVQEAKVESIQKQQALVTKGIENEYNAKLALLRNYYANNGLHNTSSGKLPSIPNASDFFNVVTANNLLAGQCSETTLMLVELQKWLNEQIGIK